MASLRVTFSDIVPADKASLFQWWTEFAENDHAHLDVPGLVRTARRTIEREDNTILLEDEAFVLGRRMTSRVKVRLSGNDRVDEEATGAMSYCASYYFEDLGGNATRLTAVWEADDTRAMRALSPLAAPAARLALRWDMRQHIENFLREQRAGERKGPMLEGHPTVWGARQFGR